MKLKNIKDIAQWRWRLGCGVYVYVCPEGNVRFVDVENDGIRPNIDLQNCKSCGECVKACPGYEIAHRYVCAKALKSTEPEVS